MGRAPPGPSPVSAIVLSSTESSEPWISHFQIALNTLKFSKPIVSSFSTILKYRAQIFTGNWICFALSDFRDVILVAWSEDEKPQAYVNDRSRAQGFSGPFLPFP